MLCPIIYPDVELIPMHISLHTDISFILYDSTSFAHCQDRERNPQS